MFHGFVPTRFIRIKSLWTQNTLPKRRLLLKPWNAKDKEWQGLKYTLQVAPEDCTGCALCVEYAPSRTNRKPKFKQINIETPARPLRENEKRNGSIS